MPCADACCVQGTYISEKFIKFRLTGKRRVQGGTEAHLSNSGQESDPTSVGISHLAAIGSFDPVSSVTFDSASVGRSLPKTAGRKGFPVAYPDVCAAFLSCNRLGLLRRSMRALIWHMEEHEPNIPYEIAWVDNDSGEEAVQVYRYALVRFCVHVCMFLEVCTSMWGA